MSMQEIEADFGINLKDLNTQDICMKLGEVEYVFNQKTCLWKTKTNIQDMEELNFDENEDEKKKKSKDGQLSTQEIEFQIRNLKRQIEGTQKQIGVVDKDIQIQRDRLKKIKQEHDLLTHQYINEFLETDKLIKQAEAIKQIQALIYDEERKN